MNITTQINKAILRCEKNGYKATTVYLGSKQWNEFQEYVNTLLFIVGYSPSTATIFGLKVRQLAEKDALILSQDIID